MGTVLLGAGTGYAAGVVGPPVRQIDAEFDVSLTAIGLLTSVFFVGLVAANLATPWIKRRIGVRRSAQLSSLVMGVGGLVTAAAPDFWTMLGSRAVVGLGVGLAIVMGGLIGRNVGGAVLIGVFGAAITVAVAVSLLLGGALDGAGVDWRVNFVVAAAVCLSALPFFFGRLPAFPTVLAKPVRDVAREFVSARYWQVALLFLLVAGVPLIVSAWIVHYLTDDDAMSAGAAGAVGFLLFAVSTVVRPAGGRVDDRHHPLLILVSPFLAAGGFVLLALDNHPAVAVPAIVVLGVAFSIPYAISYIRSEDLIPGEPAVGLSAALLVVNLTPVVATPAVGAAFEHGHAPAAWLALGGVALVTGIVNLPRPAPR